MSYFEKAKEIYHGVYGKESSDYMRGWKRCKYALQKKVIAPADVEISQLQQENERLRKSYIDYLALKLNANGMVYDEAKEEAIRQITAIAEGKSP